MKVRFNAVGNSFPWLRVVLGAGPGLFGLYGLSYEYRRWSDLGFFKPSDLAAAAVLFCVGGAVALWGAWRVKHPAQWIELDTSARVLTLGLGGPLQSVPFSEVGTLSVVMRKLPVKRRYVDYPFVVASGLPDTPLYAGLDPAKAAARKAELEALLAR